VGDQVGFVGWLVVHFSKGVGFFEESFVLINLL